MTEPGRRSGRTIARGALTGVLDLVAASCVGAAAPSPSATPMSGFGPARWAVDPDCPSPGPATTTLHVLVWELACSSGSPTTRRMSAPRVVDAPGTVTITIGVRPLSGTQTCPQPPGTATIVHLSEPLGRQGLLDGGAEPPAPPTRP